MQPPMDRDGRPPSARRPNTGSSPLATMAPEELLAFAEQKLRELEASRLRVNERQRDLLDRMIATVRRMRSLAEQMIEMSRA